MIRRLFTHATPMPTWLIWLAIVSMSIRDRLWFLLVFLAVGYTAIFATEAIRRHSIRTRTIK